MPGHAELLWQGDGDPPLHLYALPAYDDAPAPAEALTLQPASFDVGLTLIGFQPSQPWPAGEPVLVTLIWRIDQPAADSGPRDFTAFNHVIRPEDDQRVAQVDGLSLPSRDWRKGDILYQRYWITVPEPGRLRWLAGLYSRVDGTRSHLPTGEDAVAFPVEVEGR
jgi:hypothetical protein